MPKEWIFFSAKNDRLSLWGVAASPHLIHTFFIALFFHFSRRSSYAIQDSGTIFSESESEEENLSESEFKIFEDDNDRLIESQGFEDNISTWAK